MISSISTILRKTRAFTWIVALVLASMVCGCTGILRDEERQSIRVMTYNIHHGAGTDGKVDLWRIAGLIQSIDPDLVALQEVDRGAARSGRIDQIVALSEMTNMAYAFGKTLSLETGGDYGIAILTRFPIVEERYYLYRMSSAVEQRGIMRLVVDVNGTEMIIMNTHLDHSGDDRERLFAMEQLIDIVDSTDRRPKVLCGDFNDQPGSPCVGRARAFFDDGWAIVRGDSSGTFPAGNPQKRIDYVFLDRKHGPIPVRAFIPKSNASDHQPVVLDFRIDGEGVGK